VQAGPGEFAPPPEPPATPGSEVALPEPAPPPTAIKDPSVELAPLTPVPDATAVPPAPTVIAIEEPGVTVYEELYKSPPAPPPAAFPAHPPDAPPPTTRTAIEVTFAGIVTVVLPTVVFLYTQLPEVRINGEIQLTDPAPTVIVALSFPDVTDEIIGAAGFSSLHCANKVTVVVSELTVTNCKS
jgi:hypothetical protein